MCMVIKRIFEQQVQLENYNGRKFDYVKITIEEKIESWESIQDTKILKNIKDLVTDNYNQLESLRSEQSNKQETSQELAFYANTKPVLTKDNKQLTFNEYEAFKKLYPIGSNKFVSQFYYNSLKNNLK